MLHPINGLNADTALGMARAEHRHRIERAEKRRLIARVATEDGSAARRATAWNRLADHIKTARPAAPLMALVRMTMLLVLMMVGWLLAAPAQASQIPGYATAETITQAGVTSFSAASEIAGFLYQTFTPEHAGEIVSIALAPARCPGPACTGSFDAQFWILDGGPTGTALTSGQSVLWTVQGPVCAFDSPCGLQTVVLTSPVGVQAGHQYTIKVESVSVQGFWYASGDPYPGGSRWYLNQLVSVPAPAAGTDMTFEVVIEAPDSDGDGVVDDQDAFPDDATRAVSCEAGSFGAFSCEPAPPGTFVNMAGQLSATNCPAGRYQPDSGQTSCLLADPGYYVPVAGAIAQFLCPVGSTSEAGAVECYRINTAPTADVGGPYLGAVNTAVGFDGSGSTDLENDALSYAWDFGDGYTGAGVNPAHAYAGAGIYDVCLTVSDGDLGSEQACTITVVYDPSAGFVTGGGWIDSPEGAYPADPSLAGRATFGFVSKYKKGASVPTGNTEFQFKAGAFNFHSDTYEWLVVNQGGTNAQFKGSGTVNGGSEVHKFMIWAGDGSPDTFRIRIWTENAGIENVVYDNGTGQSLGGGSIVIHTAKK
ncbi:MAG: PKD domain-containing protein [Acidimicrobiia bacterium]|nr:PKD domain-containing protein [Acidimicrobiia bacterium]MDH5293063.1 PKD domain-containing protein [Acidimicrobiia bacterium]